ncbi:DUF47 family protein [Desulfovibrio sp. OttesenSCG-928-A18]|nr:DUF47 family protein [Desulfovibrio sp. OttesenSCG-928-A18]
MFHFLLPKGAPFFELLIKQNDILCAVASSLAELLRDHTLVDEPHRKISLLEEEADGIYLTLTRHLSQTFITPIDREDILHINKAQEEAINFMQNMANRLYIFEFDRIRFPMLQLGRTLNGMTVLVGSMLRGLSRKRDSHDSRAFRVLHEESEMLLSMGLVELHDLPNPTTTDLLDMHKWSQTYDRMELVIASVVDLAQAIEEAVLKNV